MDGSDFNWTESQSKSQPVRSGGMDHDQLQKILAIAEEPWRTLYCILTMDGLRAGEVLGLQWQDIDFDRRLLHIRRSARYGKIQTTKSQASQTILPIPDALIELLKFYRAQ
jgi:integrase